MFENDLCEGVVNARVPILLSGATEEAPLKRLPRDPMRFEAINAFAVFGREEKVSLREANTVPGFVASMRAGVERSLQNDAFLQDRKSTRLNSSHLVISYAVFCLKKKKKTLRIILYRL